MLADVVDSDNYTCVEKSDLGNIESKPPSAGVMASRDEITREKYLKGSCPVCACQPTMANVDHVQFLLVKDDFSLSQYFLQIDSLNCQFKSSFLKLNIAKTKELVFGKGKAGNTPTPTVHDRKQADVPARLSVHGNHRHIRPAGYRRRSRCLYAYLTIIEPAIYVCMYRMC